MSKSFERVRRHLAAIVVAVVAIALTLAAAADLWGRWEREKAPAEAVSGEITNWGLSFQQEGQPPVANATEEYLAQFDSVYCMPTEEKKLYLTFDAGFENGSTEKILDALKKHGVKATFFLVGNYFETQPGLVRRMVEEGHTVGNHTYSHPDMSSIGDEESFRQELEKNEALYKEVTGEEMPKLYRPPQGKFCESNLKMAQKLGYRTIFWSLAYVDWYENDQPTPQQAYDKLLPRVHPGAVVLLHSTSKTNGEILDELLGKWEELGYSFGDLAGDLQ
ncbi:delta-lactam-biosynthetic de-N-acetylase [Acutalibacter sp. 1XD8-33]|uniref:polysaccharide deacetylase family protein n=1 Tax=Acutalibacter sp. 1XD8-33 TaxID=2320081 RepID=UPI000EA0F4C0|nr:polysaccharide deacetylase family protein [Acutalibacter sp. 1XD8-33]RKJ39404.1 delta-lactam-biosynthetic de-N-acetylase [Acutalibacter sp. 1XD8-33]